MLLYLCLRVLRGKVEELTKQLNNCPDVKVFKVYDSFVDLYVMIPTKTEENKFLARVVSPTVDFTIVSRENA